MQGDKWNYVIQLSGREGDRIKLLGYKYTRTNSYDNQIVNETGGSI